MMKHFKGSSAQIFRMKNKAVKEGYYKFWAIFCAQTGFSYKVMPTATVGRANKVGPEYTILLETQLCLGEDSLLYARKG